MSTIPPYPPMPMRVGDPQEQCPHCHGWKYPGSICTTCFPNLQLDWRPNESVDTFKITAEELMKADKAKAQLEDRVKILEEALEEAEAELIYKEAQLQLALELALKAHTFRDEVDRRQLELPLTAR